MTTKRTEAESMIGKLNQSGRSFLVTVLGLLLVAGLGVVDYVTGAEISFAVFYLLPVFAVAWFAGHWGGSLTSASSAVSWLIAELRAGETHSHPLIPYWNTFTRLLIFLLVTMLVSAQKRRYRHEEELARTDSLTGVNNARFFFELCNREIDRARRYKHPLTIIYIDADDFKEVNDRFGHNVGDEMLRVWADSMKAILRSTDIIARLGGDEFAGLLPQTGYGPAQEVIGKLRQRLVEAMRDRGWAVTFSFGAVSYATPPESAGEMIRKADDLMYAAKASGKNAVEHQKLNAHGW